MGSGIQAEMDVPPAVNKVRPFEDIIESSADAVLPKPLRRKLVIDIDNDSEDEGITQAAGNNTLTEALDVDCTTVHVVAAVEGNTVDMKMNKVMTEEFESQPTVGRIFDDLEQLQAMEEMVDAFEHEYGDQIYDDNFVYEINGDGLAQKNHDPLTEQGFVETKNDYGFIPIDGIAHGPETPVDAMDVVLSSEEQGQELG